MMPYELQNLNNIQKNISAFNQNSLTLRKSYREKLDLYVRQVLTNLSNEEESRNLLINAQTSNESLLKVRELLDKNIVSDKEILDLKLRKLIEEALN